MAADGPLSGAAAMEDGRQSPNTGGRPTQKQRVLEMLRTAGVRGVTNSEFYAAYLPRYGARVWDLKQEGYEIESFPDGQTAQGAPIWRFRLKPKAEQLELVV